MNCTWCILLQLSNLSCALDELLLVERREAPPASELVPETTAEAPTMAQITAVTAQLPKRNYIHDTDAGQYSDDVSVELITEVVAEWEVC